MAGKSITQSVEDLSQPTIRKHSLIEDAAAILLAALFVALGVALYTEATLSTGSTAGAAMLLHYVTGVQFGILFFFINLPFYALALWRMGIVFAAKTVATVGLISVFVALTPDWVSVSNLHPVYAAIVGGGLMGTGMLMLIRHKSSMGGVNILGLYLQENFGIRAGYVQLGIDMVILVAAFFVLPWDRVIYSLIGAFVLNIIIALNHRPGRYFGMS